MSVRPKKEEDGFMLTADPFKLLQRTEKVIQARKICIS